MQANKLDNLEKIDTFLETHNLPRLHHEKIENLNRYLTSKFELVIKKIPTKKHHRPDDFISEFYQTSKELSSILLTLQKI